jgi:ankyrin repeat protein
MQDPHPLRSAIQSGDAAKVSALIEAGADIKYRDANGYDALIDAVHGRDVQRDPRLIELLELLVKHRVGLSGVSRHNESGVRVLSRLGRFDAVQFLLKAGADPSHLQWTPLIEAVAFGSLSDVENRLRQGAALEERDYWERTAWLIAIQTGDIAKAELLRKNGADTVACGRCAKPPLFYAIENRRGAMLRWLLTTGLDPEQTDEFGTTSLITAVEADELDCVEALLATGIAVDRVYNSGTAIGAVKSRPVALGLLEAGADPAGLSNEGRRVLAGLAPDASEEPLRSVSAEAFRRARTPRFGKTNPEEIQEPFWQAMIRAGVNGYAATNYFAGPSSHGNEPVWCAERFGQTVTLLPDGRAIQIGGEHEDFYDPDFCIYNDVFVHESDGSIRIYGYPEAIFPPTDFHTATLFNGFIYIIGGLGYGREIIRETPVFRLHLGNFEIERLHVPGDSPGWIHRHHAALGPSQEILIRRGQIVTMVDHQQVHTDNARTFVLDLTRMQWRSTP